MCGPDSILFSPSQHPTYHRHQANDFSLPFPTSPFLFTAPAPFIDLKIRYDSGLGVFSVLNLALVGEGGHRGGGSIVIGQSPDGNERIGFQFLARQAAINIHMTVTVTVTWTRNLPGRSSDSEAAAHSDCWPGVAWRCGNSRGPPHQS